MSIVQTHVRRVRQQPEQRAVLSETRKKAQEATLAIRRAWASGFTYLRPAEARVADSIGQKIAKNGEDVRTHAQIAADAGVSMSTVRSAVTEMHGQKDIIIEESFTLTPNGDLVPDKHNDPNTYRPSGALIAYVRFFGPDAQNNDTPYPLRFSNTYTTSSPSPALRDGGKEKGDRPRRRRASAPAGRSIDRRQKPPVAPPSRSRIDSTEVGKTKKIARDASTRDFWLSEIDQETRARLTNAAYLGVSLLDQGPLPASDTEATERASTWRKTGFQALTEDEWNRAVEVQGIWAVACLAETHIQNQFRTRTPIHSPTAFFQNKCWRSGRYEDPLGLVEKTIVTHAEFERRRAEKIAAAAPAADDDARRPDQPAVPPPPPSRMTEWRKLSPGTRTRLFMRYRRELPSSASAGAPDLPSDELLAVWEADR